MDRITNKLPGDPAAIVLAILSLCIILLGCCCGVFAFVSLTLSIIALVMAGKSMRAYAIDPEAYDFKSYKTMNTARILGIIGVVLSLIIVIAQAAFLLIHGRQISNEFWKEFQKRPNGSKEWKWEFDSDGSDSAVTTQQNDTKTITLKRQGDSIVIDSTEIQTPQ